MAASLPRLRLAVRDRPCSVTCEYDPESALLTLTFEHEAPASASGPRHRIERELGIREPVARLCLGEVDVSFTARRLQLIDLRTDPAAWYPRGLPTPNAASPVWFDPEVEFDENFIAAVDVSVTVSWDAERRTLGLSFTDEDVARWVELAAGVYAGITDEDRLCELRCSRCVLG
jgi:hypothetical protein